MHWRWLKRVSELTNGEDIEKVLSNAWVFRNLFIPQSMIKEKNCGLTICNFNWFSSGVASLGKLGEKVKGADDILKLIGEDNLKNILEGWVLLKQLFETEFSKQILIWILISFYSGAKALTNLFG